MLVLLSDWSYYQKYSSDDDDYYEMRWNYAHQNDGSDGHSQLPKKILAAFDDIIASVVFSLQQPGASLRITFETFDMNENDGLDFDEFVELMDVLDIGEEGHEDVLSMEDKKTLFKLFQPCKEKNMITFEYFEKCIYPPLKHIEAHC